MPIEKTCECCGAPFHVPPSREAQRTCSYGCRHAVMPPRTTAHNAHIGESLRQGRWFQCEVCGKRFWRKPYAIKRGEWVTWVYHPHTGGSPLRKASRAWCWFALGGGRDSIFTQEYRNPTDRRVTALLEANRQPSAYDWWEYEQVKNVSPEKTEHPC